MHVAVANVQVDHRCWRVVVLSIRCHLPLGVVPAAVGWVIGAVELLYHYILWCVLNWPQVMAIVLVAPPIHATSLPLSAPSGALFDGLLLVLDETADTKLVDVRRVRRERFRLVQKGPTELDLLLFDRHE